MKRVALALVMMVVLVLAPAPAQADPPDGCIVNIQGPIAVVVCGGEVIGNLPLPTVTVSAPPVTLPPLPAVTQIVPGPTKTATVTVPGPTATVTQPGGTQTYYVTQSPAPITVTKTANAGPVPTETVTATQTATATATATATQTVEVDKASTDNVLFDPPPLTAKGAVGYSVLALLLICGLIILGLWLGYIMGYKDSEREEAKFLSALRDQFYTGKHS